MTLSVTNNHHGYYRAYLTHRPNIGGRGKTEAEAICRAYTTYEHIYPGEWPDDIWPATLPQPGWASLWRLLKV